MDKKKIALTFIGLTLLIALAFYAERWVSTTTAELDAIVEMSDEEKLTDNLQIKMEALNDSKRTLDRAEKAHKEALELFKIAGNGYTEAMEIIQLYESSL